MLLSSVSFVLPKSILTNKDGHFECFHLKDHKNYAYIGSRGVQSWAGRSGLVNITRQRGQDECDQEGSTAQGLYSDAVRFESKAVNQGSAAIPAQGMRGPFKKND